MRIRSLVLAALLAAIQIAFNSGSARAGAFELIAAQSKPGPTEASNTWGGVLAYSFSDTGAAPVAETGIPASSLTDPQGLLYVPSTSELFVSNRTGNTSPTSVVNPFLHPVFGAFTGQSTISGNSLSGAQHLALNPISGELYVGNLNGPISRFNLSGATATPNGTINTTGIRGLAVSPDGKRLFYTTGSTTIRQFDLTTNTELSPITVPGAETMTSMVFRNNSELYLCDWHSTLANARVVSYTMDSGDNLTAQGSFLSNAAFCPAFSPDKSEMFVSGHGTGVISEYTLSGGNWVFLNSFQTPVINGNTAASLGDIIVIPAPEPASLAVLGLGGAALLMRRRERKN